MSQRSTSALRVLPTRTSILVIDDDQAASNARTALLQSAGYCVFRALTADAATAIFVEHEIDIVVSGHLPNGTSSAELSIFMKHVRPGLAVVLLSDPMQTPRQIKSQVDAVVRKDSPPEELLERIARVVGEFLPERSAV
jgi:DNA-binding NtrC family response regulator